MKNADCVICGSKKKTAVLDQTFKDYYVELVDPAYQKMTRRWVACDDCGFVYHDPQLDDRDLKVLYDHFRDEGLRNETPDQYFDRITSLPPGQSENHEKVLWLKKHAGPLLAKPGTLLDIGCGGGVFAHTFMRLCAGWRAFGVEPTATFAELARRRAGMTVVTGMYSSALFDGQKFDLITANQVLEHVPDPAAFLRGLRSRMSADGLFYLETPHVSDLSHLPEDHDRFLMQHLSMFSQASLTNVCRQAGFDIVAVERQRTLRDRNNLLVLIKPAATGAKAELEREMVKSILALKPAAA